MIILDLSKDRPRSCMQEANLIDLANLCAAAPRSGNIVEVGVFHGGSAWVLQEIAKETNRKLHLFDTFSGMPEKSEGDFFEIGMFSEVKLADVMAHIPDAVFHVGVFPNTLPEDLNDLSFVHIDCDQMMTCKEAIKMLWPRMMKGGIMTFDDYTFPNLKLVIDEFFGDRIQFTKERLPYVENY